MDLHVNFLEIIAGILKKDLFLRFFQLTNSKFVLVDLCANDSTTIPFELNQISYIS